MMYMAKKLFGWIVLAICKLFAHVIVFTLKKGVPK